MSVERLTWRPSFPTLSSVASVVIVLAAWQLLALSFEPNQFPGLLTLAENFVLVITGQTQFDVVTNISLTLIRIVIGFVIVMILGTAWGVFMGVSSAVEDYLSTFIIAFLTFPSVIWAFLGVLWFGLTAFVVPVFVIVMIVFPYVTVNMWEGTKDVDNDLIEMADAFKASDQAVWRHIYIPHLTPYLFATMRLAFTIAWKLSLVAEIFGSAKGVGVVINYYYINFQTGMILAWALPIVLLMMVIERILQYAEQRSYRWRPDTEIDTIEAVE